MKNLIFISFVAFVLSSLLDKKELNLGQIHEVVLRFLDNFDLNDISKTVSNRVLPEFL